MSPLILNAVLEELIMAQPVFKEAVEEGKLVAFSDVLLILAEDKEDAHRLIKSS